MRTQGRTPNQVGLALDGPVNPRHTLSGMQDPKLEVSPDALAQWSNADQVVHYGGVEEDNVVPIMPSRFVDSQQTQFVQGPDQDFGQAQAVGY